MKDIIYLLIIALLSASTIVSYVYWQHYKRKWHAELKENVQNLIKLAFQVQAKHRSEGVATMDNEPRKTFQQRLEEELIKQRHTPKRTTTDKTTAETRGTSL